MNLIEGSQLLVHVTDDALHHDGLGVHHAVLLEPRSWVVA